MKNGSHRVKYPLFITLQPLKNLPKCISQYYNDQGFTMKPSKPLLLGGYPIQT